MNNENNRINLDNYIYIIDRINSMIDNIKECKKCLIIILREMANIYNCDKVLLNCLSNSKKINYNLEKEYNSNTNKDININKILQKHKNQLKYNDIITLQKDDVESMYILSLKIDNEINMYVTIIYFNNKYEMSYIEKSLLKEISYKLRELIQLHINQQNQKNNVKLFKNIIKTSDMPMIVIEAKNATIYKVNKIFIDHFKFRNKCEVMGKTIYNFIKSEDSSNIKQLLKLRNNDIIKNLELNLINNNNINYCIEISATASSSLKGKFIYVIIKDITNKRNNENRYDDNIRMLSNLMNNLPGIAFSCLNDPYWTMLFISDGFKKMTGYSVNDILMNKKMSFNDIIHPDDRQTVWNEVQYHLDRKMQYQIEYRIIKKNRNIIWVWEQSVGIFDSHGKIAFIEGFITDITENKRTREKLNKLNEELEEIVAKRTEELEASVKIIKETQKHLVFSEKMASLGMLVSGVAHEINTPIGNAMLAASLQQQKIIELNNDFTNNKLKKSTLEDFINTYNEIIESLLFNLKRASKIVQSFKQVAVDQTHEELRTFNLNNYLDEIINSLKAKFRNTNHTVNIQCSKNINIKSYPGIIYQIISNLILNSLMHAFDGIENGKINIKVDDNNNYINIIYEDNGIGIKEENIKKIYEPFYTTKRSEGGTGLGLHIVYNLITQKLKGMISCESMINKGTKFIIEIKKEY